MAVEGDLAASEEELRVYLRSNGLAWIEQQVDEGLAQALAEDGRPPSAQDRLAALMDAVAFAFEIAHSTENAIFDLVDQADTAAAARAVAEGREPPERARVEEVAFVDPLGRFDRRVARRADDAPIGAVRRLRESADAVAAER